MKSLDDPEVMESILDVVNGMIDSQTFSTAIVGVSDKEVMQAISSFSQKVLA